MSAAKSTQHKRRASVDLVPSDEETMTRHHASSSSSITPRLANLSLNSLKPALTPSRSGSSTRKRHKVSKTPAVEAQENVVDETEDLELLGEILDEEESDCDDEGTDERKPIRILTDFTIFDAKSGDRPVLLSSLEVNDGDPDVHASGLVKPLFLDDEDAAEFESEFGDEDLPRIRLSTVFRYTLETDPNKPLIWIHTQFAWYILDVPSSSYKTIYERFWTNRYLARLSLFRSESGKDVLRHDLRVRPDITQEELGGSFRVRGKAFTKDEITNFMPQAAGAIEDFIEDAPECLQASLDRLVNLLYKQKRKGNIPARTREGRTNHRPNVEISILNDRHPTVMTPFIKHLASALCFQSVSSAEYDQDSLEWLESNGGAMTVRDITCNPRTVIRDSVNFIYKEDSENNEVERGSGGAGHIEDAEVEWQLGEALDIAFDIWAENEVVSVITYECVKSSEEKLTVGDSVVVWGESTPCGAKRKGRRKKGNDLVVEPEIWFGQVQHIFEYPEEKICLHLRWYTHASQTDLQESAHPRELCLTNMCDNMSVHTIAGKIQVDLVGHGIEPEGRPYSSQDKNAFFFRFLWDEELKSFTDARQSLPPAGLQIGVCYACGIKNDADRRCTPEVFDGILLYQDIQYHLYDFVYVAPKEIHTPFQIGQIVDICTPGGRPSVVVRLFGRLDDWLDYTVWQVAKQPRRLFMTHHEITIFADQLEGICYIRHRANIGDFDHWILEDDHFFVDQSTPQPTTKTGGADFVQLVPLEPRALSYCKKCDKAWNQREAEKEEFERGCRKLKAMDLYSGAGGLTEGLKISNCISTDYAIDFSPSSAKTFAMNHPGAIVYNQCANRLLERQLFQYADDGCVESGPLLALDESGDECPPLPHPGEVDFIYCGPPCQGFSVLNSHKREDDIKNTLPANAMSYVDYYRPEYFMLENVRPILSSRTTSGMIHADKYTIERGITKLILRSLTGLGYQVRYGILQAGQYGAPQSRGRAFFWAAKLGSQLPDFLQPTHTWPTHSTTTGHRRINGGAPLPFLTCQDAIGDLTPFNWENPRLAFPQSAFNEAIPGVIKDAVRKSGASNTCGFDDPVEYACQPLTPYQAWCRGDNDEVSQHYTRRYGNAVVERVCNIPLRPGVDHRVLPHQLQMWHLSSPHSRAAHHHFSPGKFGRVAADQPFLTTLTRVEPTGKQGTVLHPTQHRVFSVRELARSQGFRDSYIIASGFDDVKDVLRQIGNAVPIPLGRTLGFALKNALMLDWHAEKEKERENRARGGSPELGDEEEL